MTPLPNFERAPESPPLPHSGSAVVVAKSGDGLISEVILHGSYRVTTEDRERLGPYAVRHQIWLLAVHRTSRVSYLARPGANAVVFPAEEPTKGEIEGWFHAQLSGAAGIPSQAPGLYDVTAFLGPLLSKPIAVMLRSG
jgi:hypothetical protein